MAHGIAGHFLERARFSRRLSMITLGVSLGGLGMLLLSRTPPLQRLVRNTARFGYEGADQYVRRITLHQYEGHSRVLADIGEVSPVMERKGGGDARKARAGEGKPSSRAHVTGPGTANQDLFARAVSRSANVPVVRSEDLVIDRLVRPKYPDPLAEQNVEGKVTIQALIDTVGRVVDVQVLASTGERLFEEAAQEAVWQCRFRPYRPDGVIASEVYAVFRFAFRVY